MMAITMPLLCCQQPREAKESPSPLVFSLSMCFFMVSMLFFMASTSLTSPPRISSPTKEFLITVIHLDKLRKL